MYSFFSFKKRKKFKIERGAIDSLSFRYILEQAGNRFLPGKREKSSRVNRDDDDDIFICIDGLPRYDPSSFLPACVSLAFETRTFASNRRETVHANINYNPYLNPYPSKRAYPPLQTYPPFPSFFKSKYNIQHFLSFEFHRNKFPCASVFIRKI